MANIWITGANGQLGTTFRHKSFSLLDELFFTDVDELDITHKKAVFSFIETHDIDTIINCAAYTAVDRAEEEVEMAERVNRDGVANLAHAAYELGCLLIHISTDYVFDGMQQTPYTEKVPANPRTVYGRSKWEGEKAVQKSGCLHIIIRTGWLYSDYGSNFVKTILRLSEERPELNVVNDQWGTPTYAGDLADMILQILDMDDLVEHEGIYHYSGGGSCTWYDFAREIVSLSGRSCQVNPVTTDLFPSKAKRPAYSVLDKTKICDTFDVVLPDWRDSLRKVVNSDV